MLWKLYSCCVTVWSERSLDAFLFKERPSAECKYIDSTCLFISSFLRYIYLYSSSVYVSIHGCNINGSLQSYSMATQDIDIDLRVGLSV